MGTLPGPSTQPPDAPVSLCCLGGMGAVCELWPLAAWGRVCEGPGEESRGLGLGSQSRSCRAAHEELSVLH